MENKDWGESPLLDIIQLLDLYQKLAVRTAAPVEGGDVEKALFGAIALAGESGEILDYMKKVKYHGHDFNLGKFLDEVGDQLWYIARICDLFQIPMSYLATYNIEKLKRRYPEGAFSTERSVNREK